ncbi:glycosyltransferase family 4 protein [Acidomonas methanolica]|uniref:Glycosyl transferase n=2 Tax=Acidomonas methanolica TaxID=437 RepID=A0A023DAD0_ACIMT|nr:glycosyltransferase family 4 protein [Acidomonas methanolica]MBU2655662.1 glycosyltransferase family 4 protein [Acidomonas methanolica]TCS21281.1 glycosyltransferase involved in cell wall biosynthesis [Acidomonas methanolica]GAJ30766.1 glycosyl transferase [Acidomonas methanolica NBRC 104435]GEL00460.1 hypothetical protein AME01nite_29580 [Acidomonas methanolica NBRC 104435]
MPASSIRVLFAFENPLPSAEADAEVFLTTARYLAPALGRAALHVPVRPGQSEELSVSLAMPVIGAWAPLKPAILRHFACGATLVWRRAFRQAEIVYTRNLWVAWMAIHFGRFVVFDHYRPWPDQIPPLQPWLRRLMTHRRFLLNICHSQYTLEKYRALSVPEGKLVCIHNGFEPARMARPLPVGEAKRLLGIPPERKTVVYTGRINRRKGLELVLQAARALPDLQFLLVGSYGDGPIEAEARDLPNVTIVPWQAEEALARYIHAADVLLIPPSSRPLLTFGSTVLPLKVFLYLAAGRPILAGNTPDLRDVLRDGENALLCPPDDVAALVDGLTRLTQDTALAARLVEGARKDSRSLTWAARAERIARAMAARLDDPVVTPPGGWTRRERADWRRRSLGWLRHVLRSGNPVLPPR